MGSPSAAATRSGRRIDVGDAFRKKGKKNRKREEIDRFLGDLIARNKGSDRESDQRIMKAAQLRILVVEKDQGFRTVMAESLKVHSAPAIVQDANNIREAMGILSGGVLFDRIIVDGNHAKDDNTVDDLLRYMENNNIRIPVIVAYNSESEARSSGFNYVEELRTHTFTSEITDGVEKSMLDLPNYKTAIYVDYKTRICGRQGHDFVRDPLKAVITKLKHIIANKRKEFTKLKERLDAENKRPEDGKQDDAGPGDQLGGSDND